MAKYLAIVRAELVRFSRHSIRHIARDGNRYADSLAQLATTRAAELHRIIPVEHLPKPSIDQEPDVMEIDAAPSWMDPFREYLLNGVLPEDRDEAKSLKFRAARYTLVNSVLYRRGFAHPLLRCLLPQEADTVLSQTHDGICGNHTAGRALAQKILRQGYYWPTLHRDAETYAKRCDKCQRHSPVPRAPPAVLQPVVEPIPFARWGIDFIGALPTGRGGCKYALVAVDYFTKWIEAKPLKVIDTAQTILFVENQIIHRFGIPVKIVSDNGLQFDSGEFGEFLKGFGITHATSAVAHPQANGQVEAANKTLKTNLRRRLEAAKGRWVDELSEALWSLRTTTKTSTGETPYALTYGAEAMLPSEVLLPPHRRDMYDEETNMLALASAKDLLEERRLNAKERILNQKRAVARYYNKRVKPKGFRVGDLVLRLVMPNTKEKNAGVFAANWEGPYKIRGIAGEATYYLAYLDGKYIRHAWNAQHLKLYYP